MNAVTCRSSRFLVAGVFAVSLASVHSAPASKISDTEDCADDQDSVSMLQDFHLKRSILESSDAPLNLKLSDIPSLMQSLSRAPPPNSSGLSDWEKEYIEDAQGGPFFDDTAPVIVPVDARSTTAPVIVPVDASSTAKESTTSEEDSAYSKMVFGAASSSITAALILACLLLLAILLCKSVPSPAEGQVKVPVAWYTLSNFIAVFVALLICTIVRDVSTGFSPPALLADASYMNLARFFVIFIILEVMLFVTKRSFWILESVGQIGGFVLGFAVAQVYAHIQQSVSSSVFMVVMTMLGITMFTILVLVILIGLRPHVNQGSAWLSDTLMSHAWAQWRDTCKETELVAASVALGNVFCTAITYAILGDLKPSGLPPLVVGSTEVVSLALVGFILAGLLLLAIRVNFQHDLPGEHTSQMELFVLYVMGMTSAWCMMTTGQWVFWHGLVAGAAHQVSARLLTAAFFSTVIALLLVVLIGMLGIYGQSGKHLQVVTSSMGLLLGLAWESFFARASLGYGRFVQCCLCLGFALFFLPAWGFYILPHAVHKPRLSETIGELAEDYLKGAEQRLAGAAQGWHR